ncbi:MAG: hypothetical protein Harvfovirus17_18 [Harvfovirus sp.]|uniref:Uncharacterized protein n=1 Tax=Harvfovirus sp. TaxID=2487768 RepID=A0A3G5A3S0_9VIRU|nr:MAG: hypothetical protein Harvfovirus17_18 [Harvfovirus sp.]
MALRIVSLFTDGVKDTVPIIYVSDNILTENLKGRDIINLAVDSFLNLLNDLHKVKDSEVVCLSLFIDSGKEILNLIAGDKDYSLQIKYHYPVLEDVTIIQGLEFDCELQLNRKIYCELAKCSKVTVNSERIMLDCTRYSVNCAFGKDNKILNKGQYSEGCVHLASSFMNIFKKIQWDFDYKYIQLYLNFNTQSVCLVNSSTLYDIKIVSSKTLPLIVEKIVQEQKEEDVIII